MAKAAKPLPIQSRPLNRRALLRGGSLAAAAVAAAGTASAPASALPTAQPTELGRAFIAAVQENKAAWAAAPQDGLPDEEADALTERLYSTIKPLAEQINAMPVTSVSQLVDRAIVAASDLSGNYDIEPERMLPLVRAVCALAGLKPEDHFI